MICQRPERGQAGTDMNRWAHYIVPVNFRGMSDFGVGMGTPKPEYENTVTHTGFAKRAEKEMAYQLRTSVSPTVKWNQYLIISLKFSLSPPPPHVSIFLPLLRLFNCYFLNTTIWWPLIQGYKMVAKPAFLSSQSLQASEENIFFRWILLTRRTEDSLSGVTCEVLCGEVLCWKFLTGNNNEDIKVDRRERDSRIMEHQQLRWDVQGE